jgi:membrane protein
LGDGANYLQKVRFGGIKQALGRAYQDLGRHHTSQAAAALSYYFVLSVFPALIFLSAVIGILPVGNLFNEALGFMSQVLPADAMHILSGVLGDVLRSHHAAWLSFGMLGIIWAASSAFAALIEALGIAYDAKDDRPYWKTRSLAIALAGVSGGLFLVALIVIVLGPRFGNWLATKFGLSIVFATIWPTLRWTIAICFTVLAIEFIYFLAPNARQRFGATLPGAIFSVVVWNGLSFLLRIYFAHFAHFNRTYGTLGGFIALMTWLYWTSFTLLVGAELNSELAKQSGRGSVQPRAPSHAKSAAEERVFRPAA